MADEERKQEIDCRTLLALLKQATDGTLCPPSKGPDEHPRNKNAAERLLRSDLSFKIAFLRDDTKLSYVDLLHTLSMPAGQMRERLWNQKWERLQAGPEMPAEDETPPGGEAASTDPSVPAIPMAAGGRLAADIVIVTIIKTELVATLAAFGIDPNKREDRKLGANKLYRTTITNRDGVVLTVWITMIGKPRNVSCALFCSKLSQHFDAKTYILIGIAGGPENKVKLGDAVASIGVLDIAGGRAEPGGVLPRPESFSPRGPIIQQLGYFDAEPPAEWHGILRKTLEMLKQIGRTVPEEALTFAPAFKKAWIAVGEQLLADGSLPDTLRDHEERLRAIEMEGSGFAQACDDKNYQWLIFRGISDYGDPAKRDEWQATAAASAASAARYFLETEYYYLEDPTALS